MASEALIGVVGTLTGTVLGFVLNEWSKRGKIKITFSDIDLQCKDTDAFRCIIIIAITLNVLNLSTEIKNITSPRIILMKNKKILIDELVSFKTEDLKIKKHLNCEPKLFKSVKVTDVSNSLDYREISKERNLESFYKCDLYFSYINDKGKLIKSCILKDCWNQDESLKKSVKIRISEHGKALYHAMF